MNRMHNCRLAAAIFLTLALAGCAGMGTNPRDPLEPFNRKVTQFNEDVDSVILKPTATAYREGVPPVVRTGVSNFFGNLGDAWSAVNSLLQFRLQDAGENLARFQINSIAGVFGIFDVASDLNIDRHREDFGQTLGHWGVPAGPYVVLPLLGPSTMRDSLVLPVEWRGDLVHYVRPIAARNTLYGVRIVDQRANLLRVGNVIEGAALDRYSFTRDAFMQKRQADVMDHKGSDTDGAEPKDGSDDGRIPQEDAPAGGASPQSQPAPAERH